MLLTNSGLFSIKLIFVKSNHCSSCSQASAGFNPGTGSSTVYPCASNSSVLAKLLPKITFENSWFSMRFSTCSLATRTSVSLSVSIIAVLYFLLTSSVIPSNANASPLSYGLTILSSLENNDNLLSLRFSGVNDPSAMLFTALAYALIVENVFGSLQLQKFITPSFSQHPLPYAPPFSLISVCNTLVAMSSASKFKDGVSGCAYEGISID